MATITNKTTKPLSISLPGGKKLRLGPFKSGEITSRAIDHPAVQKLIEAGEVEVAGGKDKVKHAGSGGAAKSAQGGTGGQGGSGIRRTGDR